MDNLHQALLTLPFWQEGIPQSSVELYDTFNKDAQEFKISSDQIPIGILNDAYECIVLNDLDQKLHASNINKTTRQKEIAIVCSDDRNQELAEVTRLISHLCLFPLDLNLFTEDQRENLTPKLAESILLKEQYGSQAIGQFKSLLLSITCKVSDLVWMPPFQVKPVQTYIVSVCLVPDTPCLAILTQAGIVSFYSMTTAKVLSNQLKHAVHTDAFGMAISENYKDRVVVYGPQGLVVWSCSMADAIFYERHLGKIEKFIVSISFSRHVQTTKFADQGKRLFSLCVPRDEWRILCNSSVVILDLRSGDLLQEISLDGNSIFDIQPSPDSAFMAVSYFPRVIQIISTINPVASWSFKAQVDNQLSFCDILWLNLNSLLARLKDQNALYCFQIQRDINYGVKAVQETKTLYLNLDNPDFKVQKVQLGQNGRKLVAQFSDGRTQVFAVYEVGKDKNQLLNLTHQQVQWHMNFIGTHYPSSVLNLSTVGVSIRLKKVIRKKSAEFSLQIPTR